MSFWWLVDRLRMGDCHLHHWLHLRQEKIHSHSNFKGWSSSSSACFINFACKKNISSRLPEKFPEDSRVFVVDPMLATGGTIVAALNLIKKCGVENNQIKVISAIAAPPALQKLSETFPGLQVYTGIIDPTVDDKGYIIPGLGDAGDRSFGT
ncbi:hypothetical protein CsatB_000694 [Cannabis sativa]